MTTFLEAFVRDLQAQDRSPHTVSAYVKRRARLLRLAGGTLGAGRPAGGNYAF